MSAAVVAPNTPGPNAQVGVRNSDRVQVAKMSGGLIAAIVVLCLLVAGAVILAVFLSRHVKTNKIVNYLECKNQQTHGVWLTSDQAGSRGYWLGSDLSGIALLTGLTFQADDTGTVQETPYILTTFGTIAGTGTVTSPMIGNPIYSSSDPGARTNPTPPPPIAYFDWALTPGISTVADFNGTKTVFAPITAEAGTVAALGVQTIQLGSDGYADIVFLCAKDPDDTVKPAPWHPLCVLGGVVVKSATATASANTVSSSGAATTTYNIGCMPLLHLLPSSASTDALTSSPGVSFLNAYPSVPLLGHVPIMSNLSSFDFNPPVLHQPYNKAPSPTFSNAGSGRTTTSCVFDPQLQSQTDPFDPNGKGVWDASKASATKPASDFAKTNPGPVNPPSSTNMVVGCQPLTVPAFDVVAPADAGTANKKLYSDGVVPSDDGTSKDPVTLPSANIARVGTTNGLGIARMRQWGEWSGTKLLRQDYRTAIQQSNPSITNSKLGNPYASPPVPVPGQYTPKDSTVNAITLLYESSKSASGYNPFTLGTYNADLCPSSKDAAVSKHVADPAHLAQKNTTTAAPIDEPILSVLSRRTAYTVGGKLESSTFQFVVGFGIKTGTLFLRAGPSLTTLPPASALTGGGPCAYCNLPTLTSRTVCWSKQVAEGDAGTSAGAVQLSKAPYPSSASGHVNVFHGIDAPQPPATVNNPDLPSSELDNPYAAIGAAVGRASSTHGKHASSVLPWVPLFTVPNGDGNARGFGTYYGSVQNSRINTATTTVEGYCAGEGVPSPPSPP